MRSYRNYIITKFKGTHLDWTWFWNRFEAEIDTANIPQITKFSYLKEMLHPNVRSSIDIDSLPFSGEDYEQARNILKSKYGKSSEAINAHVQEIVGLPVVNGTKPKIIHEFYSKLVTHVQALETMGKLNMINGYVRTVLDRLPGIRSDIVTNDDRQQEWEFPQFVTALEKWTQRNPISNNEIKKGIGHHGKEKLLNTKQHQRQCVGCEDTDNNSTYCKKVENIAERKKILTERKLCFNCTGKQHRASDCRSKRLCSTCNGRRHSSICSKLYPSAPMMSISRFNERSREKNNQKRNQAYRNDDKSNRKLKLSKKYSLVSFLFTNSVLSPCIYSEKF